MAVASRFHLRALRPGWIQVLVSLLIAGMGVMGAEALSQVDQDLRIMYTEYTLAATDLAHISADVIRYRTSVVRALEAPSQKDFQRITKSLPERHAHIQQAVDRYAAASLRVSRSGRSEPADIQAVRESLDAYFSQASRTMTLLTQVWVAKSPQEATDLRRQAELHAADNAGPKLIQVSLALDRLLETVADVAKDMRDEGTKTIRQTSTTLLIGSIVIALINLLPRRSTASPGSDARAHATPAEHKDLAAAPVHMDGPNPVFRRE